MSPPLLQPQPQPFLLQQQRKRLTWVVGSCLLALLLLLAAGHRARPRNRSETARLAKQQQQPPRSHPQQQQEHVPPPLPPPARQQHHQQQQRTPRVALLVLAAVWDWGSSAQQYDEPRGNGSRQANYWLSVANKRAYAQQHRYPLYVLASHLDTGRWPTWDKLLAAAAVLEHSRADWVWMTDADTFVVNHSIPITHVIDSALRDSLQQQGLPVSRPPPDVIAANSCFVSLNSGSLLLRNMPWTRQHLADVWHSEKNCNGYTDNGAFLELFKQPEVAQHYWQVPQRQLNAYPAMPSGPHCEGGTFQDADLLVHFPGPYKDVLPAFIQQHEQLRQLLEYGLAAGTCAFLASQNGTQCKQAPPLAAWLHSHSNHSTSTPAAVHSDAANASSRVARAIGAAAQAQRVARSSSSSSSSSVPCYAVFNAHGQLNGKALPGVPAASLQQQQQQVDDVRVSFVSKQQQGITSVLSSASITLSILRQPQHASEQPGTQQPLYNPGWPIALPPEPPQGYHNGSRALPHVPVTDIEPVGL